MINSFYRKLIFGFGLGFIVFIGLLLYADIQDATHLLQDFKWSLIPAILGLTLFNYLLRGVRFHYYLRQVGLKNISLWTSLRVFVGGFSLSLTPGKVGELIRVVWLKRLAGADPVRVAPATVIDRLVDGLAMAILASVGASNQRSIQVDRIFAPGYHSRRGHHQPDSSAGALVVEFGGKTSNHLKVCPSGAHPVRKHV